MKAGDVIELNALLPSDNGSEPVYVWDIPADVPFSGRGTKKVTIDSSGLAGKTITAVVSAGRRLRRAQFRFSNRTLLTKQFY